MKQPSDSLWLLITSLTGNEKTFFKRNFTGATGKGKIYLKLFDAIARQKNYDETAILKKFAPGINKKNIAFQKHYLQEQVCDALVLYYSQNNDIQKIYKEIQMIRVYRKKGLLDKAHNNWKKTVVQARKTESFALLNLLKTEFEKMILISSTHISYDELYSLFIQNSIAYSDYADMITLRDIYAEAILLKRRSHFDLDNDLKEKIKLMLQEVESFSRAVDSTSFWFRHYYLMCRATLLYLLNETQEAFRLLTEVHRLWQKKNQFIRTHCEHYLELLYMINYAGILRGEYDYILQAFNSPINNAIEDKVQRANFEAIKYVAFNRVYNKTANYAEVNKLIIHMKSQYRQWEPLLNTDMNKTVNLSLGIACFVLEQFEDALYFIKRGVDYFKDGTREEHTIIAQVLLLLTTYDMNNARLFDSQYRNTYGFFHKREKKQPCEVALVQCLNRTFYMTDKKEKLKEYKKVLDVIERHKDNQVLQNTMTIFNYPGWLKSRLEGLPYRHYVERKVKITTPHTSPV